MTDPKVPATSHLGRLMLESSTKMWKSMRIGQRYAVRWFISMCFVVAGLIWVINTIVEAELANEAAHPFQNGDAVQFKLLGARGIISGLDCDASGSCSFNVFTNERMHYRVPIEIIEHAR